MINKGTEKIDIRNNDIVIIDDVNSINMVSVESIVRDCTLLVDGKFPMPSTNSIVIGGKSKTISKITELIASKEIKSTFGSDTLFNNFKAKVSFWYNGMFRAVIDKMDSNQGEAIVFIRGDLSKHEVIFVRTLAKVGAKILIVSKNTKIDDNFGLKIQSITYNTNEQLKIDAKQVNNTVSVNIKHYNSLEDIELALYEKNETVKVIVSGIGNYDETCNFYAKLYTKLNNDTDKMLYTNGFPKPSYEVTSKIQRFNSENHEYNIMANAEQQAMETVFGHWDEVGVRGGCIYVGEKMVAFTYGSAVTYDTFDVCVEKADRTVDGAFNIINQQFAAHLPEQYVYLNREEDMGLEGLRKSKLSYRPQFLLSYNNVIIRCQ